MNKAKARRCLDPGMSVLVGSVDAQGRPAGCRAHGITSADDLVTVTVYVPATTSQETLANVAATRKVAVTATYPPDHFSVQLKGAVIGVRLAREDERPIVDAGRASFAQELDTFGVPRRVMENVVHWPAFAIEMRVQEVYEQTPGPRAGVALG